MNFLLSVLQIHTPTFVKKRALKELFHSTAAAFGCQAPPLDGLSPDECLSQYALFTQSHVEELVRSDQTSGASGTSEALRLLQERLYLNACQLGQTYGRMLHLRTIEEVMATGRILYRILGIDFQGNVQGDVVISRCNFSRFYSGQVCQIMSAMDCGLFAGLSGGGQLVFTSRITEGQPCCRARFTLGDRAGLPLREGAV